MFIHIKSWCARRRISAVQVTGWTPSEVYQLLKTFTGHWDGWESPQLFPSLKCRTKGVWLDLQSAPLKRSGFFSVDSTECMNAGIAVQVTVMQTNMNSTFTVLLNSKGKKNKSVRNDRQTTILQPDSVNHNAKSDHPPENRPKVPQAWKKWCGGVLLTITKGRHSCPSHLCGIPVAPQPGTGVKWGRETGLEVRMRNQVPQTDLHSHAHTCLMHPVESLGRRREVATINRLGLIGMEETPCKTYKYDLFTSLLNSQTEMLRSEKCL